MQRCHDRTDKRASAVLAELERTWDVIRRHHRELPRIVVVLAQGGHKFGHFSSGAWVDKASTSELPEVLIATEALERGTEQMLTTMLHEAAHGLSWARGVRDCSQQQRHNAHFRDAAAEVGLIATEAGWRGWATTELTDMARERYSEELRRLAKVATIARRRSGGSTDRNYVRCECPCGRTIRAALRTMAGGQITCGECGGAFEVRPARRAA